MTVQNEDSFLIARIQTGDINALGILYQQHRTQVYRTALAITHDEGMAEDILQETFVRIYKYAESFDKTQPFEPWLYRLTVNLTYSWINRAKRWVHLFQGALEQLKMPEYRNPENVMEKKEQQSTLQRAIGNLPDSQRAVIVLYYLEDLSVSEIAYALNIAEGTVKSRLYHARKKVKESITERDHKMLSEVVYDVA